MTVASGVRPYAYNRDQFTLQEGETIGYSGILFEEPMFVLTAERAIYLAISEANRKFTKYINKEGGVSADFEPRPDGQNLDGQYDNPSLSGVEDGPGNVAFRDYIVDLRTALSGLLMSYITEDIDYSGIQAVEDYFHANQFPGPDGLGRTWTHPDNNEEPSGLATSGALYDIDLREVQYQPYPRAARHFDESGIAPDFIAPIMPSFISRAGGMVNVSALDVAHARNLIVSDTMPGIIGSGYDAADSGNFLIVGDGFTAAQTKLRIGYDLLDEGKLDATATGVCQSVGGRTILENMGNNGLGIFSSPALTLGSGIYAFHVFDESKSGTLGIWPPILNWRNEGFDIRGLKYENDLAVKASGVHVFNEGMWSANSSGMALYSPHNGAHLWQRFADQEEYQTANMASASRWGLDTPNADPGASTTLTIAKFFSFAAGGLFKDEYYVFATYNKRTGALLSSSESGPFTVVDPLSAQFVCGDLTDHSTHEGGIALGGYTYCNARESSDSFLRCVITDGTNPRGSIQPSGFGTAVGSPELVGTIGGRLMGSSAFQPLDTPYRMFGLVVDQTQPVFPLPVSSGTSAAGRHHSDSNGPYEIMMEQELGHKFQSLTNANFSPTNNWRIIKGQGDLSGKDFMVFNAKPVGVPNQFTYLGEVQITTSGASDIVEIIDMIGPFQAAPAWIDDFTS